MKYSIVIVAYKAQEALNRCLQSLAENPPPENEAELIIVDNSPERLDIPLKPLLPKYLRVIVVWDGVNRGFAEGCNEGARHANGANIVLVNPDTMVFPNWAEGMAKHLQENVGAVGPISNFVAGIQRYDFHMQPSGEDWEKTAKLAARGLKGRGVDTKLLIGFFLMVPKTIWDELGGLDPQFFLGCDDLDFSWRLKLAGYDLIIASDVFVYHEGHASFYAAGVDSMILNKQAEKKMLAKLAAHYRVLGQMVPTSTELWGCEILPTPIGARQKLSICMIVRDDEENLFKLLPQLGFADEIVIVNTNPEDEEGHRAIPGIIDDMVRLALPEMSHMVKAYHRSWDDDFSAARNFSLSKCTGDWVLWLDADDRIPEQAAKEIRAAMDFPGPLTAAKKCHFAFKLRDHLSNGRFAFTDQPRLFPRLPGLKWEKPIHEDYLGSADGLGLILHQTTITIDHTGYKDHDTLIKKHIRNRAILEKQPDSPHKYYHIAKGYAAEGSHAQARATFERALGPWEGAVGSAPDFRAQCNYLIALLWYQERGFATEEMDAHLLDNPKPDALFLRAERAYMLGHIEDAAKMYIAYLELVSQPNFMDFFGSERDTFGEVANHRLDMIARIRSELAETVHG